MSTLNVCDVVGHHPDNRRIFPGSFCNSFLVGIEIELENVVQRPEMQLWQWKNDHSLRNNGAELVVPHPVGGLDLEDALDELAAAFLKNPQWVANDRCSVHCHLDFRSSTLQDVVSFYVGWLLFESSMYTISGKSRYSNIYCPGANQYHALVRSAHKLLKATTRDQVVRVLDSWPRYSGVNLAALARYGSVEIRTHRGTASVTEITEWLQVLDRLKMWTTGKHPSEIVQDAAEQGATAFAHTVFGPLTDKIICDNYNTFFSNSYLNACDVLHWDTINIDEPEITPVEAMADYIISQLGE